MRVIVGVLLTVVLVGQSLVTVPAPAVAQTTPPPAADAASVRIDEPDISSSGGGVSLPVNLRIDPTAGIPEDALLQLVVDIGVDEQPHANAPVAVTAAEVIAVDTDVQGRLQVAPQDLGSWQELTSAEGVDFVLGFDPPAGAVTVVIELVHGDPPTSVSSVTSRTFDVEPDGETLVGRIQQDYEADVISADDAARYSLLSAIDPDYRAAPYADLYEDDISEDPQALGLFAVSLESEISDATRAELQQYFAVDDPEGSAAADASKQLEASATALGAGDYPDCELVTFIWHCVTSVDSPGGAPISLEFEYRMGGVGDGFVPDVDVNPSNQRPDRIDELIAAFEEASKFYDTGLAMNTVDWPVAVKLSDFDAGLSLPAFSGGGTIWIPPQADADLVRHELFHQVEYQYLSKLDIAAHYSPMYWLIEATAEWATYHAGRQLGGLTSAYAANLPAALGAPHRALDETDQLRGGPEYGSFLFIEYLDQVHGGHAGVESILIGSGAGEAGHRPTDVIADHLAARSSSWAAAIVEYRQWSYLLTRDANHNVGFEAPGRRHTRPLACDIEHRRAHSG